MSSGFGSQTFKKGDLACIYKVKLIGYVSIYTNAYQNYFKQNIGLSQNVTGKFVQKTFLFFKC